jgi:multidrug efflux system outer membrane protein
LTDIRRYDLNLTLPAFEVDLWGRLAALSAGARARLLATREAARTVRMGLISDIASAYFSLLELEERERLTAEILRTRSAVGELTQRAVDLGAAAMMEQLQARSQIDAASAELEGLRRQRLNTQNLLDMLTGYSKDALPPGQRLANQSLDAAFVTGLPSEALLLRPDVSAAEQRLVEARANIEATRAQYFPRILLAAGVGVASASLGSLISGGKLASSLVPSVSLPLFDGGRTTANVGIAEARERIAVAEYQKTVRAAFREVADLLAAQETFRNQTRLAAAELATQRQRCEVIEARFNAGAVSQLDVLECARQRLSAEAALASYRRVELTLGMQLYKALGGGGDLPDTP